MNLSAALTLIGVVLFAFLVILGVAFPRTKADWTLDRQRTVILLLSGIFFAIMAIAVYYAVRYINWPNRTTTGLYAMVVVFLILVAVGLAYPQGVPLDKRPEK